jgi:hypothetical protein
MPEDFQSYDWFIAEFADSPTTVTINAKKMRDFLKSIFNRRNVEVTISRALAPSDSKALLYYAGATPININLPGTLLEGFNTVFWNIGTAAVTFVPTGGGVTATGELVLAPGQVARLEQRNGNTWKVSNIDALASRIAATQGGASITNARLVELVLGEAFSITSVLVDTDLQFSANITFSDEGNSAGTFLAEDLDPEWDEFNTYTVVHTPSTKTVNITIAVRDADGRPVNPTIIVS